MRWLDHVRDYTYGSVCNPILVSGVILDNVDLRISELEGRITVLEDIYKNIAVEIGGVPDGLGRDPNRPPIRRRLHILENERHTAEISKAAVDAAIRLHDSAKEKRFSRREKLITLACAIFVASGSWLSPIVYHSF